MENFANYRVTSNASNNSNGDTLCVSYNRRILVGNIFNNNTQYQSMDKFTILKNKPMSRIDLTIPSAYERLQTYVTTKTNNSERLFEETGSIFLELESYRLRRWSHSGYDIIYNGTRPCKKGYNFYVINDHQARDIYLIVKSHQENVYAIELRRVSGDDYVHIQFDVDEFLAFAKCMLQSKMLPCNNKIQLRSSEKQTWAGCGKGYMLQNNNLGIDFCDFWPNYNTSNRESRMFLRDKKIQFTPHDSKLEIKVDELDGFCRIFYHAHDVIDLLVDIQTQRFAVHEHMSRNGSANLDSYDFYHTALSTFYGLRVTPKRRYPASYIIPDYILPTINMEFNMWHHLTNLTSEKSPAIYHARTMKPMFE